MKLGEKRNSMFSFRSVGSLIILVAVGVFLLWINFHLSLPSPAEMRKIILSYGWAGWLIFIGGVCCKIKKYS